ncbi:MAG TPA: Uma2 family endonuclease [Gemmataceae bacterium]|nr:Uma2 family endonuclease [Gemmataceae bacterium]
MASPTMLEAPAAPAYPSVDEALYEVVDGRRVELPSMGVYASWIASELQSELRPFAKSRRLGTVVMEALFILDAERNLRRRPDIAFVSSQRWPLDRPIPEEGDWEVVPDLAVEVTSPNDRFEEVFTKIAEYFRYEIRQAWIVAPRIQNVLIFDSLTKLRILTAADELDGGELLPGFRLPLASLFQRQAQAGPLISS